jgi:hypothetical protein
MSVMVKRILWAERGLELAYNAGSCLIFTSTFTSDILYILPSIIGIRCFFICIVMYTS